MASMDDLIKKSSIHKSKNLFVVPYFFTQSYLCQRDVSCLWSIPKLSLTMLDIILKSKKYVFSFCYSKDNENL